MAGTGTGYPHTLRCAKCKRLRDWRQDTSHVDAQLRATGKFRKRSKHSQRIRCIPWPWQVEYECLNCGHKGWTTNSSIEGYLVRARITPPWKVADGEGNEGSDSAARHSR